MRATAHYAHLALDSIQHAAARITGSVGGNLDWWPGPGRKDGGNMEALRRTVTKLRCKFGDGARKPHYVIGARGLGYHMPEAEGK
ncbi:MAG: hypothetical protein OXC93_15615 [Rhodospirillaceae bacterium]|nr:hypothetical protein [Rhodospirillaceae bacterium]